MVGQAPDRSVAAIVGGDGSGYADENRHRVLAAALGHKSPGAIDLKLFQTYVHEWFAGVPVYSPRSAQPILWSVGGFGMFMLARHLIGPPWGACVVMIGFLSCAAYTSYAENNRRITGFSLRRASLQVELLSSI